MITAGELFENAINHWRENKGVGTALVPKIFNDKVIILGILQRMYSRSPTCNTMIITDNFQDRLDIIEFLTNQEETENNEEFKKIIADKYIKIFTVNYLDTLRNIGYCDLVVLYHTESLTERLKEQMERSKFKLVVLRKFMPTVDDMAYLYTKCPLLSDFKQSEIDEVRTSTPVKEYQIGVTIDNQETVDKLNRCNEYVATSLNIFGSFEIMQQARVGNTQLNISANQICANIAQENGWSETLDMSSEFNREIDALYNPINLRERALQTYEVIRVRAKLLSDYSEKLPVILDIINNNKDKHILIINKRAEFASAVTEYVNDLSESIVCGNHHDKVENIPAVDIHGMALYYKSGARKGERRMMGAQSQKTLNEALFATGKLHVLSCNASPDKNLTAKIDIVIITSPQCEDIKSYMYRLSNVTFNIDGIDLYSIYCKDTMEEARLSSKEKAQNHEIINNCENSGFSEENSDFIIVD